MSYEFLKGFGGSEVRVLWQTSKLKTSELMLFDSWKRMFFRVLKRIKIAGCCGLIEISVIMVYLYTCTLMTFNNLILVFQNNSSHFSLNRIKWKQLSWKTNIKLLKLIKIKCVENFEKFNWNSTNYKCTYTYEYLSWLVIMLQS